MATTDTTNVSLGEYRVASIEELGFSKEQAQDLTDCFRNVKVRDSHGVEKVYSQRIDHHYIRELQTKGCSNDLILKILI